MKKFSLVLFATLLLSSVVVQANDIYLPPGSDQPSSQIPNHDPACFQYVIHDQNLVSMTKNTSLNENKMSFLFISEDDVTFIGITRESLVDPIEDPFEAFQMQVDRNIDPIGVISKYGGNDWLALATPVETGKGCKYIYLRPLNM